MYGKQPRTLGLAALVTVFLLSACSSGDGGSDASRAACTAPSELRIDGLPTVIDLNDTVKLSAVADGDCALDGWDWAFGDGNGMHGGHAEHRYTRPGLYTVRVSAMDPDGQPLEAHREVEVVAGFCPLVPISIESRALDSGKQVGDTAALSLQGGDFHWLRWTEDRSPAALIDALTLPGTSHRYRNPAHPADHRPSPGDWVDGTAADQDTLRAALDRLLGMRLLVAVNDQGRKVSEADQFRIAEVAAVRLNGYRLDEAARLELSYEGEGVCRNTAPGVEDSEGQTPRDTSVDLPLNASDAEGDQLHWHIVDPPQHGTIALERGTATYTPDTGYVGKDRFTWRADDGTATSTLATVEIDITGNNHAPQGQDIEVHARAGQTLTITLPATDADADTLGFQLVSEPRFGGVEIRGDQALFTPDPGFTGLAWFEYRVSDGIAQSAPARVNIRVDGDADTSQPQPAPMPDRASPVIISSPSLEIRATRRYAYPVVATDTDPGDVLSYRLDIAPGGMTIDVGSGAIAWTPTVDDAGTHPVTIRVTDTYGLSAIQRYQLAVYTENRIPSAIDQVEETGENLALDLTLRGTDGDGDPLVYRVLTTPEHGTLVGDAPALTYLPEAFFEGEDVFTFVADDGEDLSEPASVHITVNGHGNNPPRIVSDPIDRHLFKPSFGAAIPFNLYEWEQYDFPNDGHGSSPNWFVDQDGTRVTQLFNAATSLLLTPTPATSVRIDGIWRVDAGDDDYVGFVFGYLDPYHFYSFAWKKGAQGNLPRGIVVKHNHWDPALGDTPPYYRPQSTDGSELLYLNTSVGWRSYTDYHYTLVIQEDWANILIVDGEGAIIDSITLSGLVDTDGQFGFLNYSQEGVRYSGFASERIADRTYRYPVVADDPDGDSLSYRLLNAPEGMGIEPLTGVIEWETDESDLGAHQVLVEVTDSHGATATQSYDLWVGDDQPAFVGTPNATAYADSRYSESLVAFDPNPGEALSYSLPEAPRGMGIDPQSGELQWLPTLADVGLHPVSVIATDSQGNSDSYSYTVEVLPTPSNANPSIVSAAPSTATVGRQFSYAPQAVDSDGDRLEFVLVGGPLPYGLRIMDGRTITWIPTADQVRNWTFDVEVSDGRGGKDRQTVTIEVLGSASNHPPVISPVPRQELQSGVLWQYRLHASDPDADALLFRLLDGPAGLTIDGEVLQWTPSGQDIRAHEIRVRVEDGRSGYAEVMIDARVVDPLANQGPVISSRPNTVSPLGEAYGYQVVASDPNGDTLTYRLVNAPAGSTLDDAALFSWIPDQVGNHRIEIEVSDSHGAVARQVYSLTVSANTLQLPNTGPIIASAPPTITSADQSYEYVIQAVDAEDIPSLRIVRGPRELRLTENILSWTPTLADLGNHEIAIEATDPHGASAYQQWTLSVYREQAPGNHTPEIQSIPPLNAKLGRPYNYLIQATDADGDTLRYTLIQAPAGMGLSEAGEITWTPTREDLATIRVRVDDGQQYIEQGWTVRVLPEQTTLTATIQITPNPFVAGEPFEIHVLAADSIGALHVEATLDGEPLVLDPTFRVELTLDSLADHHLRVNVQDSFDTVVVERTLLPGDPDDTDPPLLQLRSPVDSQKVTAPTTIQASIQADDLTDWQLLLTRRDGSESQAQILVQGSEPIDGELAVLDPTQLFNGLYLLQLQARDRSGNQSAESVVVQVEGNLKLGPFRLTLEDLAIPVAGIPVRIERTYDSRQRNDNLAFGQGWSLDYQDIRIDESRPAGRDWALNEYRSGPFSSIIEQCVQPRGPPKVVITLPDGSQEAFEVHAEPECTLYSPTLDVHLDFRPVDGSSATLNSHAGLVRFYEGNLIDVAEPDVPLDIDHYTLTTAAGYVYQLDQGFGIRTVTDPNGNTLTYSDDGIRHSSGVAIDFERDANGRIRTVIDPKGQRYQYAYDDQGDLISVTDPVGATQTYGYLADHYLQTIDDPLGRRIIKNIYDDDGRLIAQEDGQGKRTAFQHDLPGRQSVLTDRLGRIRVLHYDDRGNVLSETDALGGITRHDYDVDDNLIATTDPLGHTQTFAYDTRRNLLSQTDPLGNTTRFSYNARNQETQLTDARGNTFHNTYDDLGNLLEVSDPLGYLTSSTLDIHGQVIADIDALGQTSRSTYDVEGNKISEIDSAGGVTTFTYDENHNVLAEIRSRMVGGVTVSDTTSYVYDARDRVIQTTDAVGNVTRSEYDLGGNETASIDARGIRTESVYDAYGQVIETRYQDGSRETKTYDVEGNLIASADRFGRVTRYAYDALNRQTQVTFPDGSMTSTEYDAAGRVISETDERGYRTEYEYDAADRRTVKRDALGYEQRFEYDADGNLTAEIDANGSRIEYTYNGLDQRIRTEFPNGSTVVESVDALFQRTAHTDAAGVRVEFDYDSMGRLARVTDALGNSTTYTYDEAGNKLTQTDTAGRTTRWTYDPLGRIVSRTLPMGQQETFTYDPNGNLLSHTDFNGRTTAYQYDTNDRRIRTDYANGKIESFIYDLVGNRTQIVVSEPGSAIETYTYTYDQRNRLIQETQPDGTVLSYRYDAAGNRDRLTIVRPDTTETTMEYLYDGLNRLQGVTNGTGTTSYTYDGVGNRTRVNYPNGTSERYAYDNLNRVIQKETYDGAGALTQSYAYTLDPTGRRTRVDELGGNSIIYSYDNLYRLTRETIPGSSYDATYSYDVVGNRTQRLINGLTTNYTYDDNDRLVQQGDSIYDYDDNGNTLSVASSNGMVLFDYDDKNQLVSMVNEGLSTYFAYSPSGIRTRKIESDQITAYVVDANRNYAQVLIEDGGESPIVYTHGDDLISQTSEEGTHFYHYDGLGSTRALTNAGGTVTDSYDYAAFGQLLNRTGETNNQYLFTGEQFDSTLNQYYLRARYYDAEVGRFSQMDMWEGNTRSPLSLNKYLYGNADPANFTDPTGYFGLAELGATSNIRATLATTSVPRFSALVTRAVGASLQTSGRAITKTAIRTLRRCIRKQNRCGLQFNLLIVGYDNPEVTDHIRSIQIASTVVLTYQRTKSGNRRWYNRNGGLGGCKRKGKANPTDQCDEYPFFKTREGGPPLKPWVSLRWVPMRENLSVGGHFGYLSRSMNKSKNREFVVVTSDSLPTVALPLGGK